MCDLYQVRRDLIAMRSMHSANSSVTKRINKLLGKIAHVREPESPAHEAMLKRLIERAMNDDVSRTAGCRAGVEDEGEMVADHFGQPKIGSLIEGE